jgi:2-oxoglutarate/2-oxoacid ferredoxin oxidoreductase subunit beta
MVANDVDIDRALAEERPGPPDIDSVLAKDTLADVMSGPPAVLGHEASLADALRLMREHGRGCVLVVRNGKLAGVFTERDVLMKIAGNPIVVERTGVSAYMTRDPVTLPPDAGVALALHKMVVEGFRHLPIVDDQGRPAGVVSMRDIMEHLSDFFRKEILNLPPDSTAAPRKQHGP